MGSDNTQFHQRFWVWRGKTSERSSTFSLRFTAISSSVSVGPRQKSRSTHRGQRVDTKIKNFPRRFEWKFGKAVGLESSGLQKVSSSLQEVGNLPTRVYISSKCYFGLG